MTLDDIRAMSKPTILASEAAQVLGCTPQWLRLMAREQPEKLGFPVCCTSKHRECQAAQIINGLKRKGLDLDAQKLVTQNARLARLVRRMQETKEDKRNAETDSQRRRLV